MGMEWQPIETAPKDGTLVDLWMECRLHPEFRRQLGISDHYRVPECQFADGQWIDSEGDPLISSATHWLRVEPPKCP